MPKVLHYYREPHPFFGLDVLIVGGKNSAAIAALELWRHGVRVTMVHRREGIGSSVKYWIKPDIENRIKAGQVKAYFNSTVKEITPDHVVLNTPEGEVTLANDWVFALTGYHPDFDFLRGLGIQIRGDADKKPVVDPRTLESNVPGIYLAGVVSGRNAHQRDLHREWALSRAGDRGGLEGKVEAGSGGSVSGLIARRTGVAHPCPRSRVLRPSPDSRISDKLLRGVRPG